MATATETQYYYDEALAQRAIEFFPDALVHIKGERAGQPFELEPWQAKIVGDVFGTLKEDGTRRYRTVYLEIPRKNGKTTLGAGVALYSLVADGEAGAEVYSIASEREQAALCFNLAREMVVRNDWLKSLIKPFRNSLLVEKTASGYKPISAEVGSKHGFNTHCGVFDEFHAQKTRDLYDVIKTSMGSRKQPLLWIITTSGFDRQSICYEVRDYATKVADGVIDDPSFYSAIYAAPDDADWKSEEVWAVANPNLGVSVSLDYLRQECATAQAIPAYENTFRRLHLNQWTEQDNRWFSIDTWNACEGELPDLVGWQCCAGLDLSATTDLTSLALVFRDGEKRYAKQWSWIPEDRMHEREKKDGVPYSAWVRGGTLIATPGAVVDYEHVRATLIQLAELYGITEIAIDRWNATQLATQLEADGFSVIMFGQGYKSMSAPSKQLEKLLVSKNFVHETDEVYKWAASNVAISEDPAGNIKPDKSKATNRIDPIVATIMALDRLERMPETSGAVEWI